MGILHWVPLQMTLAKIAKIDYGTITVKQMTEPAQLHFDISRQTKISVCSKNRIFSKNPIFLKILCPKIYGTLLTDVTPNRHTGESRYPEHSEITGFRLSPE